MTPEEYQLLNELIAERFGIHHPPAKVEMLASKLRPRLQALNLERFQDYYLHLQYDFEAERPELSHAVTNNETYFFRETYQFQALFEDALRSLIDGASRPGVLRFLCAGCSSGEEPYTLNIYAQQHRIELAGTEVRVDAMDIDPRRLEIARAGIYGPNSLRSAGEDQIRRYFSRSGSDRYELGEIFRQGVQFYGGNILEPNDYPATGPFDALFCRNVLIYFSEEAIHRAITNFARALRPGGLLFLGHSESIIGISSAFETVRLKRCIAYRRV